MNRRHDGSFLDDADMIAMLLEFRIMSPAEVDKLAAANHGEAMFNSMLEQRTRQVRWELFSLGMLKLDTSHIR